MTTRREFIKNSTVLAAGAVLAPKTFSFSIKKKPVVIILGAGLSGLSAGKMLSENGIEFKILEARNRVGGRVFSHKFDGDGLVIELGAEWIGGSHERIIELCKELKLELLDNRFKDRLLYGNTYYKPGEWDYSPDWKVKFDNILADYKYMTDADKKKLDRMDWWRFLMNNDIPAKDLDIREYADSTDFGESIRFVSAYAALAEYAESNEYNEMDFKVKGGNYLISEALAGKTGLNNILLNHSAISVEQGTRIKVTCANGEVFECDKVICTLPTFSLSKIKFTPGLPEDKIDAINSLQYSRIIKSATLFNKRFWDEESFSILSDSFSHYFYHATKHQGNNKGVLISYAIGDKADILSKLDKESRQKLVAESLRIPFGDVSSYIENNVVYYWGGDNYSKGAYALYGSGQWYNEMPVLKRNFENVYFSGEHVAEWQGFMEGAINTGEEAAKEVMS